MHISDGAQRQSALSIAQAVDVLHGVLQLRVQHDGLPQLLLPAGVPACIRELLDRV